MDSDNNKKIHGSLLTGQDARPPRRDNGALSLNNKVGSGKDNLDTGCRRAHLPWFTLSMKRVLQVNSMSGEIVVLRLVYCFAHL